MHNTPNDCFNIPTITNVSTNVLNISKYVYLLIVSVNLFISVFFFLFLFCGISSIVNIVFSFVSVVCFVFVMYCILIKNQKLI